METVGPSKNNIVNHIMLECSYSLKNYQLNIFGFALRNQTHYRNDFFWKNSVIMISVSVEFVIVNKCISIIAISLQYSQM